MNTDKIEAYNNAFALKAATDEAARAAALDLAEWAEVEAKKARAWAEICAVSSQNAEQAASTAWQTMAVQKAPAIQYEAGQVIAHEGDVYGIRHASTTKEGQEMLDKLASELMPIAEEQVPA